MLVYHPPPTLGLALPNRPDVRLPDWLKDWRVLAGIGAAAVLALLLAGKHARKARRRQLLAARLRYSEDIARIKRTV